MLDSIKSEKILISIGAKLEKARKAKELSLRALAEQANVEHVQITKLEKGKLNASILTILAIAEELEMDLNDLFNYKADLKK